MAALSSSGWNQCVDIDVNFAQGLYGLAVSSFPRPWIDVFAIPEKFNMAVTESDLDPKGLKMSVTL